MNPTLRRCLLSGFTFLFLMVAGSCATRSVIGQQTGTGGTPGTGTGGMPGPGTGGIVGGTGGMFEGTGGSPFGTGGSPFGTGGSSLDGGLACPPSGSSSSGSSLSFGTAAEYLTHANSFLVALGDLNGDGKADFAVANYLSQSESSSGGVVASPSTGDSGTGGSPGGSGTGGSPGGSGSGGNLGAGGSATGGSPGGPGTGGTPGTSPGSLSVFLSSTAGYGAAQFYNVGTTPISVATGDLNGDGKADVALVNAQGVSVLFNDGSGKLLSPVSFATGTGPAWVAIGDLNGDGKADLAVANQGTNIGAGPVDGDVAVLLNMGGGTFVAANYPAGASPVSVAMADLNGDGKADLAVASGTGVSVLLNNGGGSFGAPTTYGAGTNPFSIAAGDLNGDGKIDLAVGSRGGGASVLLNVGNGTFAAAVNYNYGDPYSGLGPVVIGDLNGDGRPDLVGASFAYPCRSVLVLLNQGSGVFGAPLYVPAIPGSPYSPTLGDLNGDGKLDLVVPNGDGVAVLLNTTP